MAPQAAGPAGDRAGGDRSRPQRDRQEGYDPTYGARPLKRVIQQRIQNPLATELLQGEIPEGGRVKVDCQGGEFVFEHLGPQATVIETVSVT